MFSYLSYTFYYFPRCATSHRWLSAPVSINNWEDAPTDLPICQSDGGISLIELSSFQVTFFVLIRTKQHICIMAFTELSALCRHELDGSYVLFPEHSTRMCGRVLVQNGKSCQSPCCRRTSEPSSVRVPLCSSWSFGGEWHPVINLFPLPKLGEGNARGLWSWEMTRHQP